VVAFNKGYKLSNGVQCLFRDVGSNTQWRAAFSMPSASLHDSMFMFSAGYAVCSTVGMHKPAAGQLLVTLVDSKAAVPPDDDIGWMQVEVLPEVPRNSDYAAGQGPVAACTAPLHEDGFAASMVEWAEFQKLVGIDRVFVYDFNAGPLLKPQVDYYSRQGLFKVFEWIIPSMIMADPHQECLLPFFGPSANREKFGAARCSMHQDNYQIAW
jgi:hypothetical protein